MILPRVASREINTYGEANYEEKTLTEEDTKQEIKEEERRRGTFMGEMTSRGLMRTSGRSPWRYWRRSCTWWMRAN